MIDFLSSWHLSGLVIGVCTFLIIGLFHPLVVKVEYYLGVRRWWIFLLMGVAGLIGSLLVSDVFVSALLGVFAFSSFWSIREVFEQQQRVRRGWFPRNPKRRYTK